MKSCLNTRGTYTCILAFHLGSQSPGHPNLPCFCLSPGVILECANSFPLNEQKKITPEDVLQSQVGIWPIGQQQQQSDLEMCVRVGVEPSASSFLPSRSTPVGLLYLLEHGHG